MISRSCGRVQAQPSPLIWQWDGVTEANNLFEKPRGDATNDGSVACMEQVDAVPVQACSWSGAPLVSRVSALQDMNLLPWQKLEAILAILRDCSGLGSSPSSCERHHVCPSTNQQRAQGPKEDRGEE